MAARRPTSPREAAGVKVEAPDPGAAEAAADPAAPVALLTTEDAP